MASPFQIMASGSSKAEKPTWQKTLLAVPEQQRSYSQKYIVKSIEQIDIAQNILCDPDVCNNLKSPNVLKALNILVSVASKNGSFACWDYYLSRKEQKRMYNPSIDAVFSHYFEYTREMYLESDPDPGNLVLLVLAVVIYSGMQLHFHYIANVPETESDKSNKYIIRCRTFESCHKLTETLKSRSLRHRCESYLHATLGSSMACSMEEVISLLTAEELALYSTIGMELIPSPSLDMPHYRNLVRAMKDVVGYSSRGLTVLGENSAALRPTLEHLDFKFKRLSECHIYLVRSSSSSVARSDPLEVQWWETSKVYLEFLKRTIEMAKRGNDVDWYNLAIIYRYLLTSMLSGFSEFVSYNEIESVCNEMKSAADACAAWAPPMWKVQIETDVKIVMEDVLPFLRNANPSSYKNSFFEGFHTWISGLVYARCCVCPSLWQAC